MARIKFYIGRQIFSASPLTKPLPPCAFAPPPDFSKSPPPPLQPKVQKWPPPPFNKGGGDTMKMLNKFWWIWKKI